MALINNPKAISLINALYDVYVEEKENQRNRNACVICGCDVHAKGGKAVPKATVLGFAHRPNKSPSLCWSHYIGWTKTAQHVVLWDEVDLNNSEQVDLAFSFYLAKQLAKQANIHYKLQ